MSADGVRIVDMPDLGAIDDNGSLVGEQNGSGRFRAAAIRSYVADAITVVLPSSTLPLMDGTAATGVAATYARGDHVHPSDSLIAALDSRIAALDARVAYIEAHFIKPS